MSDGTIYQGPPYVTDIRSVIWSKLDSTTCQTNWLADVLGQVEGLGVTLDTWTDNPLFVLPDPDEAFMRIQPGESCGRGVASVRLITRKHRLGRAHPAGPRPRFRAEQAEAGDHAHVLRTGLCAA